MSQNPDNTAERSMDGLPRDETKRPAYLEGWDTGKRLADA